MIPKEIINMVTELKSNRNDGWTEKGIRDQLRKIRDYLNEVLLEDSSNPKDDK